MELNKKINEEITCIQEEKQASNHEIFWKSVNILKTKYSVENKQQMESCLGQFLALSKHSVSVY